MISTISTIANRYRIDIGSIAKRQRKWPPTGAAQWGLYYPLMRIIYIDKGLDAIPPSKRASGLSTGSGDYIDI